ncbi:MAG: HAD hydrolase-like protein [Alphaproteobacteria bacterium]|nr:HAD hydrolase-like protein [Alphaproteobacteria bacterium]
MAEDFWQNLVRGAQQLMDELSGKSHAMASQRTIPVRAILSDFDDVIGDNESIIHRSYDQLRTELAGKIDLPDYSVARNYKHHPKQFLDHELEDFSHREKTIVYTMGRHIYESIPMQLVDGAAETLATYHANRKPWAVVSNNHMTHKRWHETGLDKLYPHVPVFDNAHKPSEKSLAKALIKLGQPAGSDVIMVDENWKGLYAAAKLGLTPVYIGETPHLVLPIVEQECKLNNIPVPNIQIVRNQTELQQLVVNGINVAPHVAHQHR